MCSCKNMHTTGWHFILSSQYEIWHVFRGNEKNIYNKNLKYMNRYVHTVKITHMYMVFTKLSLNWHSYISWSTVVKGDLKAPFSIATTSRYRGGRYFFLWIVPLTFDLHLIILSVKLGSIKYHLLSLWYDLTWDWTLMLINHQSLNISKLISEMSFLINITFLIVGQNSFLIPDQLINNQLIFLINW